MTMTDLPLLPSPSVDEQPRDVAGNFLGKRSFDQYSHQSVGQPLSVNATATGDARMIVGNVNTNTTITGEVKKVKVYNFPEVQVGYSSRISNDSATIRRWLTPSDQHAIYKDELARREPKTNLWLSDDPFFGRWAGDEDIEDQHLAGPEWPNFIWLHGGGT